MSTTKDKVLEIFKKGNKKQEEVELYFNQVENLLRKNILSSIKDSVKLEFCLEDSKSVLGVCTFQNKSKPKITLYPYQITYFNLTANSENLLGFKTDLPELCKMILCHELGHAFDKNLDFLLSLRQTFLDSQSFEQVAELEWEMERIAWEEGKSFLDSSLLEKYESLTSYNLEKKRSDLEQKYNIKLAI